MKTYEEACKELIDRDITIMFNDCKGIYISSIALALGYVYEIPVTDVYMYLTLLVKESGWESK